MRKTILLFFLITLKFFATGQIVSLISPSNNYISDSTYVQFQWNIVAAASSYDLQIASDSLFTSNVVNVNGITTNKKNYSLAQSNAKYFWHVRYYDGSTYSSWSSYRKLLVFRPSDISGLTVWLRADKGVSQLSGRISSWLDKSSNSYSAVQGTSAKQPYQTTPEKLDGLKSVYYDGSNCLRIPSVNLSSTDAVSVFTFMKKKIVAGSEHTMYVTTDDIYSNNNGFYNIIQSGSGVNLIGVKGNAGYNQINCYNPIDTNYNILSTVFNKSLDPEVYAYLNSSALTGSHAFDSDNSGNFTSVPFNIASFDQGSSFYYGEMPELILYTKEVSSGERNQIINYLENHYFPPVNLGFDTSLYSLQPYILNAGKRFNSYSWSTGATSSTLSVTKSGTYSISVDDVFGNNSKDTVIINFPNTKLNFTNDTTICLGNSIQLRSMIYRAKDYQLYWSTGSPDSTITVSTAGSYWLRITDTLGYSAYSDTINISVDNFAQKVNLGNDTTFCSGNYIRVYPPLPDPQTLSYTWSDNSHGQTLEIMTTGKYKVTVTNPFGCSGKDSVYVTIMGTAPTTLFKADSICFGNFTTFTDLSTSQPGDPIVKWHWQLTSSDTSNSQNPTFTYNLPDIHNVTLTTYTSGGCSKSYSKNIIVYSQPSPAFSVDTACRNNPYQFVDQSSAAPGDIIATWDWNFGDASSHSNLKDPVHIYTHGNNYNVTLAVTTQNGCQKSVSHIIHVDSVSSPPGVPIIDYPSNNSLISDTNITFSWFPSIRSIRYKIVIASDSGFNNIIANSEIDSTHFHWVFSSANQTIFWKVFSYNLCSDSSSTNKQVFEIFSPTEIPGMKLWLKADAGITAPGGKVSHWADQSGSANDATQSNVALRPLIMNNIINGKPAVAFNGTTDRLDGTTINGLGDSSLTVLIVMSGNNSVTEDMGETPFGINNGLWIYRYTGNNSQNLIIGNNQPAATSLRSPASSLPNSGYGFRIFCYEKKKDSISKLYFNGNFIVNHLDHQTNSGFTNSNYYVGNGGLAWQSALNGNIAEIILYNKFLSDSNRQRLERYLNFKYAGPPVNLGPDIVVNYGLCPVILDAGGRFTNYLWSTGDTTQTIAVQNSGTYTVTATNYFGVQSIDSVKVTKPSLAINDTAFCLNSTVTINSGLNHNYHFLWSDMSTNSFLTISTPGTYWVLVSDTISSCVLTDTFNIVADSFPVKVSLGPPRNICNGEYLGLSQGVEPDLIYFWSNGSGNSIIVITDPIGDCPTYSVTVTNRNSCIGIDTVHLCVTGAKPTVNFSFDSVCFGSPTHFLDASHAQGGDAINGRKWQFYDNDSSLLTNPSHIFSHDGIFNVSLNVTTTLGCNTSLVKPVTVFSIPSPDFTPAIGCSFAPTRFLDGAHCDYGNIVNWHWEFDDPGSGSNDTSFQQNPIHNFDNPGTYNILQRVVTNVGCVDSIRKTVIIKSSPDANYFATTTCVGTETFFSDQTQVLPQEQILEWHWKFGDGDSSTMKNPSHLYTSSGFYTAVMKVKSLNGCWGAMTKNVKIHAMPDALFSTTGSCLTYGTQFTDGTSVFNDTITQWHWEFDNGVTSNLQNPLYVYPDTGVYNVSLLVRSNAGCADSVHSSIEVHSLPTAQFTFDPEYGDSPLDVNFYNQSLRGNNYLWNFGDGTPPSTSENPLHVYTSDGIYKITLTTYNAYNCPDTQSYYVYVMPSYSDIMVKSVNAEIKDNKLNIKAELKNVGSRRLRHLEMTAHVSNENSIIEDWNGFLSPGESMTYEFSAKFYVSSQQSIDYVCVMADVKDDNTEINKSDNEACAVLTDEFSVPNPYPNPANNKINITYIVPFEEVVDVKLYDSKGALVYTIFSGTAAQGFNKIALDISALSQGVYAYKVVFRDKIKTNRFVKY